MTDNLLEQIIKKLNTLDVKVYDESCAKGKIADYTGVAVWVRYVRMTNPHTCISNIEIYNESFFINIYHDPSSDKDENFKWRTLAYKLDGGTFYSLYLLNTIRISPINNRFDEEMVKFRLAL